MKILFGLSIIILISISIIILRSISPHIFPIYFLYLTLGFLLFLFFAKTDLEIFLALSPHLYVASILFLILPMIIGQVTRGVVRWIQLGPITIQPAEIVKPFLLIFFAYYLTNKELTIKRFVIATILFLIPFTLILAQPSLGVATILLMGFVGITFSLKFNKKLLLVAVALFLSTLPVFWQVMAPYQKVRIQSLFSSSTDPTGVGYNAIQSKISVGSGKLIGRGLGQGVQTQLKFLPEKHTDFIFAAISEEMGFLGALLVTLILFFLLYQITIALQNTKSFTARALTSGILLMLFVQITVHIGMNMGLFPITGLPLPLLSAGGSSLISTFMLLGLVISAKSHKQT